MFHNARHFRHIICNASVEMCVCVCVLKGCPKSYTFFCMLVLNFLLKSYITVKGNHSYCKC